MPRPLPKKGSPAREAYDVEYPLWSERSRRGENQDNEVWMRCEDEEGQERALRIPRGDHDDDAWGALKQWEAEASTPAADAESNIRKAERGAQEAVDAVHVPDVGQKPKAVARPRLQVGKPEITERTVHWDDIKDLPDEVEGDIGGVKVAIPRGDMDDDSWKEVVMKVGKPKITARTIELDQRDVDRQSGTTRADSDEAVAASASAVSQYGGTTSADDPSLESPRPLSPEEQQFLADMRSPPRPTGGGVPGLAGGFIASAMRNAAVKAGPVDPFSPTDPRVAGPTPATGTPGGVGPQPISQPTIHEYPPGTTPQTLQAGMDKIDAQSVVTSPMPVPNAQPQGTPGVGIAGLGRTPGNTLGLEKQINDAAAAEALAIDKAAGLESKRMQKTGELRQQAEQQHLDGQKAILAAREAGQAKLDEMQKAMDATVADLQKVEKVDPTRLWNKLTTGNKLLASIGALMGGLGAGTYALMGAKHENEAMARLDRAIQDDIAAQKDNIAAKQDATKAKLGQQRWGYYTLRQRGLDEYEAMKGEEVIKYQAAINMVDAVAMQMGSQEALAKGEMLKAQLQQKMLQPMMALKQHRDQVSLEAQKLALMQAKAAAAATGKGGGHMLKPSQTKSLIDLKNLVMSIQGLKNKFVTLGTGPVDQTIDKGMKHFSKTKASKYSTDAATARREIAKNWDESVVTVGEMDTWKPMIPDAGDWNGLHKLENLEQRALEKYQTAVQTMQQAGYDVSGILGAGAPGGGGVSPEEDGVEFDQ
jgi:hypothetical protein